jgi:predicted amidohydrolase
MRIGAAQIDIAVADRPRNLAAIERVLREAAREDVDLVVFPECTLTGYVISDVAEVDELAEEVPGRSTAWLGDLCAALRLGAVVGLLERAGDAVYNTTVFVDSSGLVGRYRKTHLIHLGVDRLLVPGDGLVVFSAAWGRCGMLICYDQRFPEAARTLALQGAQVILNPANLPEGAEAYPDFINRARACENRVFVVVANRVGIERGFTFIGRSQIIDPRGSVLAEAGPWREELIVADISPIHADSKRVAVIPGLYEIDVVGDRRPDLYGAVCDGRAAVDNR